jgi:hypothetical protein
VLRREVVDEAGIGGVPVSQTTMPCRVSQYTITMMTADGRSEGSKNYPIGSNHPDVQSFQNVPPGKHYLHVEVRNPDTKSCILHGDLTIGRT